MAKVLNFKEELAAGRIQPVSYEIPDGIDPITRKSLRANGDRIRHMGGEDLRYSDRYMRKAPQRSMREIY